MLLTSLIHVLFFIFIIDGKIIEFSRLVDLCSLGTLLSFLVMSPLSLFEAERMPLIIVPII